jgi:hypothetical protein
VNDTDKNNNDDNDDNNNDDDNDDDDDNYNCNCNLCYTQRNIINNIYILNKMLFYSSNSFNLQTS